MSDNKLGNEIKKARMRLQLSQADMGRKLNCVQCLISQWENGLVIPSIFYKKQIVQFFERNQIKINKSLFK